METYLKPGNDAFWEALVSEIFVDKAEMIRYLKRLMRGQF